jgi:hypothetical protein
LTVWSTVLFLQLLQNPCISRELLYSIVVLAGLYTNPYTLFIPIAHVIWLFWAAFKSKTGPSALLPTLLSNSFAVILFLPWYLYARHFWAADVPSNSRTGALQLAEIVLKELAGGGYIGSIVLLALAATGAKRLLTKSLGAAYLLVFWLVATIALPLIGNTLFHYFFAARQIIFALTPLCLLAGLGIEEVSAQHKKVAIGVAALVAGVCLFNDVNLFLKPRENWRTAAARLKRLSGPDSCIIFIPADSLDLYLVFDPTLARDRCQGNLLGYSELVLAASPYAPSGAAQFTFASIPSSFHQERHPDRTRPAISVYRRNQN